MFGAGLLKFRSLGISIPGIAQVVLVSDTSFLHKNTLIVPCVGDFHDIELLQAIVILNDTDATDALDHTDKLPKLSNDGRAP